MLLEGRDEVLPLLDGDGDELRFCSLAGRSGFLRGLVLGLDRSGIAKTSAALRVRRCPRHRAGRFVDILSKSAVVREVDVIELPVDHDRDRSFQLLFGVDEGKNPRGSKSRIKRRIKINYR